MTEYSPFASASTFVCSNHLSSNSHCRSAASFSLSTFLSIVSFTPQVNSEDSFTFIANKSHDPATKTTATAIHI
jgi:hypothetical protein